MNIAVVKATDIIAVRILCTNFCLCCSTEFFSFFRTYNSIKNNKLIYHVFKTINANCMRRFFKSKFFLKEIQRKFKENSMKNRRKFNEKSEKNLKRIWKRDLKEKIKKIAKNLNGKIYPICPKFKENGSTFKKLRLNC